MVPLKRSLKIIFVVTALAQSFSVQAQRTNQKTLVAGALRTMQVAQPASATLTSQKNGSLLSFATSKTVLQQMSASKLDSLVLTIAQMSNNQYSGAERIKGRLLLNDVASKANLSQSTQGFVAQLNQIYFKNNEQLRDTRVHTEAQVLITQFETDRANPSTLQESRMDPFNVAHNQINRNIIHLVELCETGKFQEAEAFIASNYRPPLMVELYNSARISADAQHFAQILDIDTVKLTAVFEHKEQRELQTDIIAILNKTAPWHTQVTCPIITQTTRVIGEFADLASEYNFIGAVDQGYSALDVCHGLYKATFGTLQFTGGVIVGVGESVVDMAQFGFHVLHGTVSAIMSPLETYQGIKQATRGLIELWNRTEFNAEMAQNGLLTCQQLLHHAWHWAQNASAYEYGKLMGNALAMIAPGKLLKGTTTLLSIAKNQIVAAEMTEVVWNALDKAKKLEFLSPRFAAEGFISLEFGKKAGKIVATVEEHVITKAGLKLIGENTYRSPAGLIYGPDSKFGNRVYHVGAHLFPDISKRTHTEFLGDLSDVLKLVDEAWPKRMPIPNNSCAYTAEMGRVIGKENEMIILIVVKTPGSSIIKTAYPIK